MLRTILAVLFAVCYLILGIPVLFVEWLIGKKNPHLRDISSLRMVQWAFRVIYRICGVKLTIHRCCMWQTTTAILTSLLRMHSAKI